MTEPRRALCAAAHPDDLEFGCAGSVARWVDEGWHVTYLIVTDGSTGTQDTEMVGEPLAAVRREETMAAAAAVGVDDVRFLGYPDGSVEPTLGLRRDIARVFRQTRPHRLLAQDPVPLPGGWFVNHPDHRAVGQATLDVTLTAGTTPGHFPELLDEGHEPWGGLREIYVFGPGGGEHAEDITSTVDRKIAALRAHASQVSEQVGDMIRAWTASMGQDAGYAHAERFHVIRPLSAFDDPD